MKKGLCFLILFFTAFLLFSQARDRGRNTEAETSVYPGRTVYLQSGLSSDLFLPLKKGYSIGGGIRGEFSLTGIAGRLGIGLSGGYSYINKSGNNPVPIPNGGIRLNRSLSPAGFPALEYYAGLKSFFPLDSSLPSFVPAGELGGTAGFHLFNGNYLTSGISAGLPLAGNFTPWIELSLGIKNTVPVKVQMDPVKTEFSISPDRFSPDNDGDNDFLYIEARVAGGENITRWNIEIFDEYGEKIKNWEGGPSPPLQVLWDGVYGGNETVGSAMYYQVEIEMEDILGNVFTHSGEILTDILVKKVGGKFKIMIPNIIFPPNSADFDLLEEPDLEKNTEILRKIASKLEKYPGYRVRIEGHGNLDFWQDEEKAAWEQKEVLIPLTEARAEMIKKVLIEAGVDSSRLLTQGIGGADPIVPFSDQENKWKNRRVEFILLK